MKITSKSAYLCALALSSACLSATTSANWQPETVIGGKLKTILYVPTTAPALAGKRALMISMHGCGQTNEEFQTGANWPATADQYGMVVALPDASREGTYGGLGCWNFHVGMSMSRNSSDAKYLLNLVDALLNDSSLNIDPNQVYITGLSSGGGMTASIGCLAPDVFAGAGVNAGPGPGSNGQSLTSTDISVTQGVSNCKTLSNKDGANSQPYLYTQVHSTICGSNDGTVSPAWCDRVSDIMAATYDEDTDVNDCSGGSNPTSITGNGTVNTFCDSEGPRNSNIIVQGMGHAWPAGPGSSGGGSYIDHSNVNYPQYVTKFFFDNNRRVITNQAPTVNSLNLSESNGVITVSGSATDSDGTVDSVSVVVANTSSGATVDSFTLSVNGSGNYSGSTSALADANYTVTVTATDNEGSTSSPSVDSIWVGPIPPNSAPSISNVNAAVNGACVTVTGNIQDVDGNLSSANATFDGSASLNIAITSPSNMSFSVENCSLAYGSHTVVINATDSNSASSASPAVGFTTIDLGKTGDVNYHLNEGTITYGEGYSWCYTAYSSAEFTMIEEETTGGQCRWVDEAGANNCAGPEQGCSTGGGNSDSDGDGVLDGQDQCPNTPAGTTVDSTGCEVTTDPDSDNDGVVDSQDQCPNTPAGTTVDTTGCPVTSTSCEEFSTYNYYHKTAGRAYSTGSTFSPDYFAEGSDESMNGSTWGTTVLHSTDGSVWHVGNCP
ncbi:MAG: PHB depolymerase family esterase [Cellvibrionaceae bacterium]